MIIKEIYSKPEIEVIEIEATSVIANSPDLGGVGDAETGTGGYSKKRNLWNENN